MGAHELMHAGIASSEISRLQKEAPEGAAVVSLHWSHATRCAAGSVGTSRVAVVALTPDGIAHVRTCLLPACRLLAHILAHL